MTRKLNPQGLMDQTSWIFPNMANFKDQVNSTFKTVAKRNALPCSIEEETYKSGGFLGSKDVLLTIDGGFKPFCVLGVTTYGNYLSVSLYTLVEDTFGNKLTGRLIQADLADLGYLGKDMINVREMNAFLNCVKATVEESFEELGLPHYKSGFVGIK